MVNLASAWGMDNLLTGLGEPAPIKGATQPLVHRCHARSQTPLPYLHVSSWDMVIY